MDGIWKHLQAQQNIIALQAHEIQELKSTISKYKAEGGTLEKHHQSQYSRGERQKIIGMCNVNSLFFCSRQLRNAIHSLLATSQIVHT